MSQNTQIDEKVSRFFIALRLAFERLELVRPETVRAVVLAVCFVALWENGVLPDYPNDKSSNSNIRTMLTFALDPNYSPPPYSEDSWENLISWMNQYILNHTDLTLPKLKV